jgi:small subunit ribosomal protein S20
MNKKQRNRKIVTQNKRNRIINRRYTSTIKTLFKLFYSKIKNFEKTKTNIILENEKKYFETLIKNFYSIIDKAIKKGVLHKNTAARKKSKIGKLFAKNFLVS